MYAFPAWRFAGRTMFLSTEDPEVVTEALAWGRAAWSVVHFRENRTNADVATMRRQRGYGRATLQSFLNLEAALEADAWVCIGCFRGGCSGGSVPCSVFSWGIGPGGGCTWPEFPSGGGCKIVPELGFALSHLGIAPTNFVHRSAI